MSTSHGNRPDRTWRGSLVIKASTSHTKPSIAMPTERVRHIWRSDGWGSRSHRGLPYSRLNKLTNRFANVLQQLGVGKGDRVFVLAGRIPELYIAALGTFKNRSVFCPLFSAFGPEPIRARLSIGQAKILVTTTSLYQRKVAAIRAAIPSLEQILLIGEDRQPTAIAGTQDLTALMHQASPSFTIGPTDPEDIALLHFTSGTTGTPKGAIHVHQAVVAHHMTGKYALDFHKEDVFWCTADPGWVTGTSYGIIAPLTNGITSIVDEGDFDAERWYGILQEERVSVWYTAPTAIRMMMKGGAELARKYDLQHLRFLASVGEPLNPEAVVWGREAFGQPFHDNWWQTETGGIMIANYAAMDIRPGSMDARCPVLKPLSCTKRRPACRRDRETRRTGRTGPASRLAIDVPRLLERTGAIQEMFRRRLVFDRRCGQEG